MKLIFFILFTQLVTTLFAEEHSIAQKEKESIEMLNAYESLLITETDIRKITTLLVTLAENNVFQLLFEKKQLERIGNEINHVHPMRFIGTVFSDTRLIRCMRQIRRSRFKWDNFIEGFSKRFQEEAKVNNIYAHVPGLAEDVKVNQEDMHTYIHKNDFEGLILFLMENARPRS